MRDDSLSPEHLAWLERGAPTPPPRYSREQAAALSDEAMKAYRKASALFLGDPWEDLPWDAWIERLQAMIPDPLDESVIAIVRTWHARGMQLSSIAQMSSAGVLPLQECGGRKL